MKKLLISIMSSTIIYSSVFGMGSPAEEQISLGSAIPAFLAASAGETATEKSSSSTGQKCIIEIGKDIDANVAKQSQTMKEMIEDFGLSEDALHLNCTKKGFALILPLMQLQHNYLISSEALLAEPAKSKEILQQKIKRVLIDSTTNDLMQIVVVANYLNIQPTFDIARKMLGEQLMNLANIEAILACPFIKELNDIPDIRRLLINNFWKKSEAFSFWIEQAQKLNQSRIPEAISLAREMAVIKVLKGFWTYLTLKSNQSVKKLSGHKYSVGSVAWSPDGNMIATVSLEIKIWDVRSGTCLQRFIGHTAAFHSVAWSPDSSKIATSSYDKTVKVWDVKSGKCLQAFIDRIEDVILFPSMSSVAWSPDSNMIAFTSDETTAKVWDVKSGKCLQIFVGHTDIVFSVVWSPDGTKIATGSWDKTVKIWDVKSGKCLQIFSGNICRVQPVAWSPDSSKIASGSDDTTAKIWDVKSGKCLQIFVGHTDIVFSVVWSPDGTKIATGSWDKTVKIWDVRSGNCLQTLTGHTMAVLSVAWSPDGNTIVTGSEDKTVKIWDINLEVLAYMQRSLSLQQALLLMYAQDCTIKNQPLNLTENLSHAFRHLDRDLRETILKTFKNTPSLLYAIQEPVD